MNNEELLNIKGGTTNYTSAGFLNALARGISVLYNLGVSCGETLRYFIKGNKC